MTWQPELDEVRRRRELAERMGGPGKVGRQHDAGRLTVRERLAVLLDDGSFDEIGTLAGMAVYDDDGDLADFTAANFVTGTGRINGRKVVVFSYFRDEAGVVRFEPEPGKPAGAESRRWSVPLPDDLR